MNPLRIAFVSSHPKIRRFRKDASFIYRCENLSLAVSELGHKVSLLHITALFFRRDFDVVVFLRPTVSWMFNLAVKHLRSKGVVLIGDVDDLIFNPDFAKFRPSVRNQVADQDDTRRKFIAHAKALEKLDKVQFSTNELAKQYLSILPSTKYTVIPNTAFRTWYKLPCLSDSPMRYISYFSGTRTHDRDLALVLPVLKRLLERHHDLIIQIVGPVSIDFEHPRLKKIKKVDFGDYANVVQTSHICIAPLEDTPFNQCKSALKAFEAGVMNIPTVASPVGEYSNVHVDGVLRANSLEEWESQLEFALHPENYKKLSTGLRERMFTFSNTDKIAKMFLNFVTA